VKQQARDARGFGNRLPRLTKVFDRLAILPRKEKLLRLLSFAKRGILRCYGSSLSERFAPDHRRNIWMWPSLPRVENEPASFVAAHMLAPTLQEENAWPTMGVHRNRFATSNPRFQDPDAVVLEYLAMISWGGHKRVQTGSMPCTFPRQYSFRSKLPRLCAAVSQVQGSRDEGFSHLGVVLPLSW
jgi:hypothetical protein